MRGREPGKGQGTGRARKGVSRAPRRAATERMERSEERWKSVGAAKGMGTGTAGQSAGDRERDPRHGQGDRGLGAAKGPKGKGKGAVGPRGQTGRGTGALGGGRSEGRGTGGGAPPQPDVQPVQCIPPGIQQMPAQHTHHHHHHHAHLYNIDPDAGELIPPEPPRPKHQPAPPAPRVEPARMAAASAGGGRGAAPAPQAKGPQGEPARRQGGASPGTGTGARSRTPWGMRPSPWWWRCTGG